MSASKEKNRRAATWTQGSLKGRFLGQSYSLHVYIDDLEVEIVRRMLEVLIVKFADNTKGAKVIESISDRDKLQEALDCLCDWADKWGMAFNISK